MTDSTTLLEEFANREYEHGFVTDVEQDTFPSGQFRPRKTNPNG